MFTPAGVVELLSEVASMNGELIAICAVIMDEARKLETALGAAETWARTERRNWAIEEAKRHRDRCENLYQRVCNEVAAFGPATAPFCGWCGDRPARLLADGCWRCERCERENDPLEVGPGIG